MSELNPGSATTGDNYTDDQRRYVDGVQDIYLRGHLLHQVLLRDNMSADRDRMEKSRDLYATRCGIYCRLVERAFKLINDGMTPQALKIMEVMVRGNRGELALADKEISETPYGNILLEHERQKSGKSVTIHPESIKTQGMERTLWLIENFHPEEAATVLQNTLHGRETPVLGVERRDPRVLADLKNIQEKIRQTAGFCRHMNSKETADYLEAFADETLTVAIKKEESLQGTLLGPVGKA